MDGQRTGYMVGSIRDGLWLTSGRELRLPDGAIGLMLVYASAQAARAKWGNAPVEPIALDKYWGGDE